MSSAAIPIAIRTRDESFEPSSYLSSWAESYRRSYGYAFERRFSNPPSIGRSPERVNARVDSIESPADVLPQVAEDMPLLEYSDSLKSSTHESVFNAVNILMGIGILSFPYAFKLTGWIVGMVLLLSFALITRHTAITVKKCLDVDVPNNFSFDECRTFGDFVIS